MDDVVAGSSVVDWLSSQRRHRNFVAGSAVECTLVVSVERHSWRECCWLLQESADHRLVVLLVGDMAGPGLQFRWEVNCDTHSEQVSEPADHTANHQIESIGFGRMVGAGQETDSGSDDSGTIEAGLRSIVSKNLVGLDSSIAIHSSGPVEQKVAGS